MKSNWKHGLAASIAFAVGAAWAAEGTRPGDKPLVVNGDLALTTLDFDAYMERVPAGRRDEFRAQLERINPTIDALWVRRVTAARARAAGLDKDPVVQARLRLAQEDILSEVYLADVTKTVKTPNLEVRARELYKTNIKQFTLPETVTAEHILVSTKTYPREVALARAKEVYQRAAAGEDFRKLAEKFTDNHSSIEINAMPLSAFEKPLPEAIARIAPGQVGEPIESQFGFHIVKMKERTPARVKTFEEVREDLIAAEKQKFIDDEKTAIVEAIRADPKNEVFTENVQGLKTTLNFPTMEEIQKLNPNVKY
jgi:peptidyl-prolyl cis-trans isomerase C